AAELQVGEQPRKPENRLGSPGISVGDAQRMAGRVDRSGNRVGVAQLEEEEARDGGGVRRGRNRSSVGLEAADRLEQGEGLSVAGRRRLAVGTGDPRRG